MRYLFDASAIFSAVQLGAYNNLPGSYTLTLARYELGNIVFKEGTIHKRLTSEEQRKLLLSIEHLLKSMHLLDIEGVAVDILQLATELKLSFYDASYLYYAKTAKMPLVTEDLKLAGKAIQYVKSFRANEL